MTYCQTLILSWWRRQKALIKTSSAYQNGGPNGEGCCYGKVSRHHPHYCRRSTLLLWHRRLRNSAFLDRLRVFWDLDRYLGKFLRDASVVSFLHHKLYLLHIAGIIFVQDGIIFVQNDKRCCHLIFMWYWNIVSTASKKKFERPTFIIEFKTHLYGLSIFWSICHLEQETKICSCETLHLGRK